MTDGDLCSSTLPGEVPPAVSSSRNRVLIADKTSMRCLLLKTALPHSRFRFEVAGCAISGSEIAECMKASPVDVVALSESLGGGPLAGFQALHELQTSFPTVRVVVLLKSTSRDLVIDVFRGGAEGVVCRAFRTRPCPLQVRSECAQGTDLGQQLLFIFGGLYEFYATAGGQLHGSAPPH